MALVNSNKDIKDVLQEVQETITLIGIKETINALKKGREVATMQDDESKLNIVKETIISVFNNSKCLESKKDDVNKSARCLLAYTLKNMGIKNKKIAVVLKINERTISNLVCYIKTANLVNPKVPREIMLKEAYEKLNEKLNIKN